MDCPCCQTLKDSFETRSLEYDTALVWLSEAAKSPDRELHRQIRRFAEEARILCHTASVELQQHRMLHLAAESVKSAD